MPTLEQLRFEVNLNFNKARRVVDLVSSKEFAEKFVTFPETTQVLIWDKAIRIDPEGCRTLYERSVAMMDLEQASQTVLREFCRQYGIKACTRLSKAEMISRIKEIRDGKASK